MLECIVIKFFNEVIRKQIAQVREDCHIYTYISNVLLSESKDRKVKNLKGHWEQVSYWA
jgi:hypothetical protein